MNIESTKLQQPALVMPQNATPLTVADALIRWCNDKGFLEDVMYYVECYYNREVRKECDVTPHVDESGSSLTKFVPCSNTSDV